MTAEIAVANKWGVALAADSAVTVEQFHKGRLREKVYNSANKLFSLSKFRPVGAMIYNTVSLAGTPWETVIKSARFELARNECDYLQHYADFLFDFVTDNNDLFQSDSVSQAFTYNVYRILYRVYKDEKTSRTSFIANMDKEISKLENSQSIDGMDADFERHILTHYRKEIDDAKDIVLHAGVKTGTKRKIDRLVQLSFVKKSLLRDYSGIVVCGFGRKEVFPTLTEYYCDGIVCGKPRFWKKHENKISAYNGSFVLPFADTEIIDTLMRGVNPKFQRKYNQEAIKTITALTKDLIDQITELTDDQKRHYIRNATQPVVNAFRAFTTEMTKYREEEYADQIQRTIDVLPLSELATVAETFLNASQIHKRVNPEAETVGGPVDVAVISKGDGFVWIKRKHYFKEELNKTYFQKYLDT